MKRKGTDVTYKNYLIYFIYNINECSVCFFSQNSIIAFYKNV